MNHGLPGRLVTRHEDVKRLLTDPRLSNDPRRANPTARAAAPWFDSGAVGTTRHMLHADGADHRRLRVLVSKADQLAAMRDDPDLLDGAVEELLRFDGPMNIAILRFTTAEIEVGDVVIPGDGQVVFVGLAAGDHDPARFAEPGTLDVRRDASGHLGFGHGAHACLGAPLGRMEARIAFRTLLRRCADLAFAIDPADLEWRAAPQIRGLRHLPVTFRPVAE